MDQFNKGVTTPEESSLVEGSCISSGGLYILK